MPLNINLETEFKEDKLEEAQGEGRAINLQAKPELALDKVVEAAVFLANREVSLKELAEITGKQPRVVREALERVARDYEARQSPVELLLKDDFAVLQVKPAYLTVVGGLSKKSDLSRKATRILALIAKKGKMLQKELQNYFRGEIYEYVAELRDAGYVESVHQGNTRLLRPTRKFYEEFQMTNPRGANPP